VLSAGTDYSFGLIDTREYYRMSTFTSVDTTTISHTVGATLSSPVARIHIVSLNYEYLDSTTTGKSVTPFLTGGFVGNSTVTGHQWTGTLSREWSKERTVGVTGTYAIRDQLVSGVETPFTRWNVLVFNNYVVADKLILRGSIGVGQVSSSGGKPQVTSDSDISYLTGPAVLALRVERGFSETFANGQNFGVVETSGVSGSVAYRFSPLITTSVTAGYRENKLTGLGGGIGQAGRVDKVITGSASLSYQPTRWLTATLDYFFYDSNTSTQGSPAVTLVENRVRASLNAILY
jgi:hypothetical protein